jgi:hypothetical protein
MRRIAIAYSWGKVRIGAIALLGVAAFAIPAFASLTTPHAQTAMPPPMGTRSNSTSTQVPGIYVADEGPRRAATPAVAPPVFSYALTTMSNPVGPGQHAVFTWTVTNVTTATQTADLCYFVPPFTQAGGSVAGTEICTSTVNVSAGKSATGIINLTVLSGLSTPPERSLQ